MVVREWAAPAADGFVRRHCPPPPGWSPRPAEADEADEDDDLFSRKDWPTPAPPDVSCPSGTYRLGFACPCVPGHVGHAAFLGRSGDVPGPGGLFVAPPHVLRSWTGHLARYVDDRAPLYPAPSIVFSPGAKGHATTSIQMQNRSFLSTPPWRPTSSRSTTRYPSSSQILDGKRMCPRACRGPHEPSH